jgi:hypothetical protein
VIVRPVRPIDVAALRTFLHRPDAVELTTHTWPKVQPESGHVSLAGLLRQAVGPRFGQRCTWVAFEGRARRGYVVARARCDGMVWDIEHLHADDEAAAVAAIEQVCLAAANNGARRVFIDAPAAAHAGVWRRAGFSRYANSALFRLNPPFEVNRPGAFAARPRLRADEQALFRLYSQAVPAPVRAAEAMTYDEWSALHRGNRRWQPSLLGDRHQFVWELGAGLAGWLEVIYGQKSQYLELLILPEYESMLDRLVGYALTQVSPKAAVYAAAREYQSSLASALQRIGFATTLEVEILVRQLAPRVPEPKLMPAQVVGG